MRTAIALAIALTSTTAVAAGDDESWDMWEQRQLMLAEMARAQALGGYSDPISGLRRIADGTATERDIVTPYRDIYDLPEYGGQLVSPSAPKN